MKKLKNYILLTLMILVTMHARSQKATAWARLDTTAIMIGDQTALELGISLPKGYLVQWPTVRDTLNAHIEVVKMSKIDTSFKADQMIMKQNLTITSFDSGYFEVPEFKFVFYPPNDTTKNEAVTGSLFLQVYVPEVDTTKPFKVIKSPKAEPYTLAELLPWIGGGLLAVALIVLLILYLIKRKKNQPLFGAKPKPLPPPDVEAITKLEELRHARIWQNGKIKEYYSALTDIMRRYMERRFGFDAPEMTSDEILEELNKHDVNKEVKEKLKGMMMLADLVKFAKAQPTPLENDLSLDHCIDFVKETKPVVVEPTEEEKKKEKQTELSDKKEDK
jgi:hypothetical protein